MDVNLILLITVVGGVIGGLLYRGIRAQKTGWMGSKMDPNPSWDQSIAMPAGFVIRARDEGWAVTSGPKLPFRAHAEIPRVVSGAERGHIWVECRLTLMEEVARVFAGPVSADWRWNGHSWEYPLLLEGGGGPLYGPLEPDRLAELAVERLAQAATLFRLTSQASHFLGADDQISALANPRDASPAVLDRIAVTLITHLVEREPGLTSRIALHFDSPRLWAALLDAPRFTDTATQALLTRWPKSAETDRALGHAIASPLSFEEETLQMVFETLEHRRDTRLPELLARLIQEVGLRHRALVLQWLRRSGDPSALPALEALAQRADPMWLETIEDTRAAITFRRQEALSHLSGGLSVAHVDGSLALNEEGR